MRKFKNDSHKRLKIEKNCCLKQDNPCQSLPDYFLLAQREIRRLGVQPCPQGLDFPPAMKTMGTRLTGVSEKNNLKCLVSSP